ncbi:MAG: hypothetical protein ACRDT6_27490, partial [Micromonosporaceae bacterium]
MSALMPRLFGDLSDWFDTDFPFPATRPHTFRVEDYRDNGSYVIRAEIPGIDPEKDVTITVANGMLDAVPHDLAATGIDNRDGMVITRPVQPAGDTVGRILRQLGNQNRTGRLHVSLLAAAPSGEAPSCGAEARLPVRSLFGARRRSALSTVGTPRATARPRRTHDGRQTRLASRAVIWRHLGCIG